MAEKEIINGLEVYKHDFNAYLDYDHTGQKKFKDSCGVWLTAEFFGIIQKAFGVTENTINQNKLIVRLTNLALESQKKNERVTLEMLDRNKPVVKEMPVVADTTINPLTTKILEWLNKAENEKFSREVLYKSLEKNMTKENIAFIQKAFELKYDSPKPQPTEFNF